MNDKDKTTNIFRPWTYNQLQTLIGDKACYYAEFLQLIKKIPLQKSESMLRAKTRSNAFKLIMSKEPYETGLVTMEDHEVFNRIAGLISGEGKTNEYLSINEGGELEKDSKKVFFGGQISYTDTRTKFFKWRMGNSTFADPLQIDMLFVLLMAWYHITQDVILGSLIFPYADIEEGNAPATTLSYRTKDCAEIFNRIKAKIFNLELDLNKRDPNKPDEWPINLDACSDCLVWASCEHANKAVEITNDITLQFPTKTLSTANAPQAAVMALALEELMKRIKKSLKTYTKEYGNIELPDGREYGHFPKSSRVVFDPRGLIRAAKDAGIAPDDYWNYIGVSPTNADKLIKLANLDVSEFVGEDKKKGFGIMKD